jgi:hypothetical protein
MKHLKRFESYQPINEEFFGIGKMIKDWASPYMAEAKEVLQAAIDKDPAGASAFEAAILDAQSKVSAKDKKAVEELLKQDIEEVGQAAEQEVGGLTEGRRYRSSRMINESFFSKIKDFIAGVLSWTGIGYAFANMIYTCYTAFAGLGEEIMAKAAVGTMFALLTALVMLIAGMIISGGKSPFQQIGISHKKLPKGFGRD